MFAIAIWMTLISPKSALPVTAFLDSIGANSSINQRGETLDRTIQCAKYLGIRWFRSGIEGDVPVSDFLELNRQTGAKFSWCPGSGGTNLPKLLETGRQLAKAGALLAFEGPNEPNNWAVNYQGVKGGGNQSWIAVANFQRDLYKAVKNDPVLKSTPVWGISEDGAETDNVGLQFLKVPKGSGTIVPDGTSYADFANVHNYIYHPNAPGLEDNKTWKSADPTSACKIDGLFGEVGVTWGRHFKGYSPSELLDLPRVTTETGATIDSQITEDIHAKNLLTLYLDQFKRGWSYTAVYLLRDRSDEGGNQQFGFYKSDYTPRKAAVCLHNLTAILADSGVVKKRTALSYSIPIEPETVHDLLLQKSDGTLELIVWSELVNGANNVSVVFGTKPSSVKIFDPTLGTFPVDIRRGVPTIALRLTDHPVIIELRN